MTSIDFLKKRETASMARSPRWLLFLRAMLVLAVLSGGAAIAFGLVLIVLFRLVFTLAGMAV